MCWVVFVLVVGSGLATPKVCVCAVCGMRSSIVIRVQACELGGEVSQVFLADLQ